MTGWMVVVLLCFFVLPLLLFGISAGIVAARSSDAPRLAPVDIWS